MTFYGAVLYQLKEDDYLGSLDLAIACELFKLLEQSIVKASILRHSNQKLAVYMMILKKSGH